MLSSFSADSSNAELEEFKRTLQEEEKWLEDRVDKGNTKPRNSSAIMKN